MITLEEAVSIAKNAFSCEPIDKTCIDVDSGWVFSYGEENKDPIPGTPQIFVNKMNGETEDVALPLPAGYAMQSAIDNGLEVDISQLR